MTVLKKTSDLSYPLHRYLQWPYKLEITEYITGCPLALTAQLGQSAEYKKTFGALHQQW